MLKKIAFGFVLLGFVSFTEACPTPPTCVGSTGTIVNGNLTIQTGSQALATGSKATTETFSAHSGTMTSKNILTSGQNGNAWDILLKTESIAHSIGDKNGNNFSGSSTTGTGNFTLTFPKVP